VFIVKCRPIVGVTPVLNMASGGIQNPACVSREDNAVGGRMLALCDACGRSKRRTLATKLCRSCKVDLCRDCCHGHQIYAPGDHVFVDVGSGESDTVLVDMKGLDICAEHNKTFAFHCQDHNSLCCEDCQFYQQRQCDKIYKITDLVNKTEEVVLTRPTAEIRNTISRANDMIKKCETDVGELQTEKNELIQEINLTKKRLVKRFDDDLALVESDIDDQMTSTKTRLADIKTSANVIRSQLDNMLSVTDAIQKSGTNMQKFIINVLCQQKDKHARETLTEFEKNQPTVKRGIEWNTQFVDVLNAKSKFMTLRETRASNIDTSVSNHESGRSQEKPDDANKPLLVSLPLKELHTLKIVKTSDDENDPLITGLDFLPDGRIAAIDSENQKIYILNKRLEKKGSFTFRVKPYPYDVASFKDNNLIVTHGYAQCMVTFISVL